MELTPRQKEILRYLISNNRELYKINELVIETGLSEKTVRNDMKSIVRFSDNIDGLKIIIKRGLGIHVSIDDNMDIDLLNRLEKTNYSEERELLALNVAMILLKNPTLYSLTELTKIFFCSINELKLAIELIKNWLDKFDIMLSIKKGQGIILSGDELSYRNAIKFINSLQILNLTNDETITKFFGENEYNIVNKSVEMKFGDTLHEEQIRRLVLHILIMIHRLKRNMIIKSDNLNGIIVDHKLLDLIKILEKNLSIKIPASELNYLMLHLPNKLYQNKMEENDKVLNFILKLIEEIKLESMIDFSNDQTLIDGLITHMRTSLFNIENNININNPLQFEIKTQYPFIYSSVVNALENMKLKNKKSMPEAEMAYLTLHFQAAFERMKKTRKKRVMIVCHLGIGISQMLKVSIEKKFTSFDIIGISSLDEFLNNENKDNIDLVITTIDINEKNIEVIKVSPLLNNHDELKLNAYFEKSSNANDMMVIKSRMLDFITPFTIYKLDKVMDKYKLIEYVGKRLVDNAYTTKEYVKSVSNREFISSTCIGHGIAIPHGNSELVNTSTISVVAINEPIIWGEEYVDLVFFIALTEKDKKYYQDIYRELHYLIEEKTILNKIRKENNIIDILKSINQ
ncbi:BglG family transcription antiterminator [Macrococcus sp. EM39E]|uniref:BglG family transcription antiterminator n=1 Tax=Macrococcus animalis TaxID=3395467 RepID=UPI0039BEB086